ncbi:hypothetical protein TPHA_0F03210 [Tetrapisispora phaffii CBS 4417]|uniref:Altered inheritance of mitochondria protein 41 n=1 Tax=Tetrapisispora phaffii (strain ATCC 24235 / CBS 4417 / NBRC 1672 / NRRL Y-8282 / UCD 70-5) TaxID=1071381 RepID=G8BUL6_TETPH|nr:hypothetical protein TPHA_0F03210 [Tetrapisispora phaffii CBS 4417]CCE63802.1 hypothetical protein TPHA_0F03210 [Tetrapisispora phaffii CBS 4417]
MLRTTTRVTYVSRSCIRTINSEAYTSTIIGLKKDLKQAMLAKDDAKKTTIRNILSTVKNMELDNQGKDFNELTLFGIYSKLIKQRKDSIAEFIKNDRTDLASKEETELAIINSYLKLLPVASQEEVDKKVTELLTKVKSEQGDNVQLKEILRSLNFKILQVQWKTTQGVIVQSLTRHYREIFN